MPSAAGLPVWSWVFRNDLILGFMTIPGWSHFIPNGKLVDDGTVALVMGLLLFFIPTRSANAKSLGVHNRNLL